MYRFVYSVSLTPDTADGGYVVTCRDLPEAITQGETLKACVEAAEGALQAALEGRIEDELDIPLPSEPAPGEIAIAVPLQTALKAAVYLAAREAGISQSELAHQLGLDEKEARHLLDPGPLTRRLTTLERALALLGKHAELRVS